MATALGRPRPVEAVRFERRLAGALAWCGWPGGAVPFYRQALRLTPEDAAAHFGLGEALARLGDWSGASWAFRAASALRPRDPECTANLALCLARSGRWWLAVRAFARLAQLRPAEAEPRLLHAVALRRAGRSLEAIRAFRSAVGLSENPRGDRSLLGPNALGGEGWRALLADHRVASTLRRPSRPAAALGGLWSRAVRPRPLSPRRRASPLTARR
jgi:hypothetical protein